MKRFSRVGTHLIGAGRQRISVRRNRQGVHDTIESSDECRLTQIRIAGGADQAMTDQRNQDQTKPDSLMILHEDSIATTRDRQHADSLRRD